MNPTVSLGLTSAQAAERVRLGQVNRAPQSHWADYAEIVRHNLLTLFNALVVPAAVALFLLHEFRDAIAVSGLAAINAIAGLVQEFRAKRHLEKLALLAETRVKVQRDGVTLELPASDVVLDDLLLLAAGDTVVADGPVVEARFLEVDEALLTGESDPVPRHEGDTLLSGSFCVAGAGSYRAAKVGQESFATSTSIQARAYHYSASPLQRGIDILITILTGAALGLCLFYIVLYHTRGTPRAEFWERVAATVTSMIPQGLVLLTTLAFTLGAVRMSRRGALVQRLNAVESMAAVNVLCLDKTGTLTTNRLRLDQIHLLAGDLSEQAIHHLLCLFANASLDRHNKNLIALRQALGDKEVEALDQLPFKSQNRYSAVRLHDGAGERILIMGACEALGPHLRAGAGWEKIWRDLLPTGLRLLMFAEPVLADVSAVPPFAGALPDVPLRPLALVALSDELRPNAGQVLQALAVQGIGFKIISGDNAETVRATIRHLPLALAHEPVVTGQELESSTDRENLIRTRSVFGRVSPLQKVEIVKTLKTQGKFVAMIGDGVNDVLPIKQAHLGIAMGEGSQASKTVSGIVLENNRFELLPETLEEGRTILRNLRRAGKLFLLKNVFSLILIVGTLGVFRLDFPYLPQQVTLLNFLTIGLPAFLLTLSKERLPAGRRTSFLREVIDFALRTGIVTGLAGLALMLMAARLWHDDLRMQRSLLLTFLILLGLGNLWRVLTEGGTALLAGDRHFRWYALAALSLYLAVLYVPVTADFFDLLPLHTADWVIVPGHALAAYLVCRWTERAAG